MKEVSVKITPAQRDRVEAELSRGAGERPEYASIRVSRGSVIGVPSELRALADGMDAGYSDDEEEMRIADKMSLDGKAPSDSQVKFGLARARESHDAAVKAIREAADKADPFPALKNRAMARGLASGETVDLAKYRQEDGTYLLPAALDIEARDLCDSEREVWIWVVGRHRETGERRAGTHDMVDRFYGNDARDAGWTCEWLR